MARLLQFLLKGSHYKNQFLRISAQMEDSRPPGILQAFSTRLALLRHSASWTELLRYEVLSFSSGVQPLVDYSADSVLCSSPQVLRFQLLWKVGSHCFGLTERNQIR